MHGVVVGDETIRVQRSIEPQTSKQERTTAKHAVRRATPVPNLDAREGRENARRSTTWDDLFNARSSTFECQRRDKGAHGMLGKDREPPPPRPRAWPHPAARRGLGRYCVVPQ